MYRSIESHPNPLVNRPNYAFKTLHYSITTLQEGPENRLFGGRGSHRGFLYKYSLNIYIKILRVLFYKYSLPISGHPLKNSNIPLCNAVML